MVAFVYLRTGVGVYTVLSHIKKYFINLYGRQAFYFSVFEFL